MLNISLLISGLVLVAVTLFIVYSLIRFRHREGGRAQYQPDNHRLEWWLLGITALGIAALLAPGLVVYSDFVRVPDDAARVQVFGEQWRFSYRYPGEDGELGESAIRHIGGGNPLGLDPDDPASRDDVVVSDALRLPVDRPVKVTLRARDVIHSFFVPEFRAKMDMVPGMVTSFWITPSRTGEFDALCAQHCGVGHFNMRGRVIVMEEDEFDNWLAQQQTFGESMADTGDGDDPVARGQRLANDRGCIACHSTDGSRRTGPSWQGLYDSEVELEDGSTVTVDKDYIRTSILEPNKDIHKGYPPVMQAYDFDDEQIESIVAFIRSLGEDGDQQQEPAPDQADSGDQAAGGDKREPSATMGKQLATDNGCMACHTTDGSSSVGPTWKNLHGREVELKDGSKVTADADYIRESITDPNAAQVKGYPPVMQSYDFSEQELEALVIYIRDELSED